MSLTWNKNLRNRLIVGFTGGPIILLCAYAGGWYFFVPIAFLAVLSVYEMQAMGAHAGFRKFDLFGFLFTVTCLIRLYLYGKEGIYEILIIYLTILLASVAVTNRPNKLAEISFRCVSTLYISLFLGSFILLREFSFSSGYYIGGKFAMIVIVSVSFLDTIAYCSGKIFGRHQLFPRVSPKKTVEGGIGGLIGAVGAILLAREIFFRELPVHHAVVVGFVIGIAGQIGDVIASFFKRQLDSKESSGILPGHGGVLDRIDSLIFISPLIYFYALTFLSSL